MSFEDHSIYTAINACATLDLNPFKFIRAKTSRFNPGTLDPISRCSILTCSDNLESVSATLLVAPNLLRTAEGCVDGLALWT